MKRHLTVPILSGIILIVVGRAILPAANLDQALKPEDNAIEALRSMEKMSDAERESLLKVLEQRWQTLQGVLLTNLNGANDDINFSSAYLLGLYRFEQAAGNLARVIDLENKDADRHENRREPRWDRYPAVEALIRIGKPSVREVLRRLETSDDPHVRALSARVIFYVEGPEVSKLVIQTAIKAQSDPVKKQRLESALPLVKGGEYQKPGVR